MEAIADIRNHQDLISQAIYEALNDQETVFMITKGFSDGVKLIQTYETAKNRVVNQWAEKQVNKLDDETQKLASELESLMIERSSKEQSGLGKFTIISQQTKERLKNTQSFIDNLLEAL
jgi:dipeptidase